MEHALIAEGIYLRKGGNWILDEERLGCEQASELAA
jgi:hypothetical protein